MKVFQHLPEIIRLEHHHLPFIKTLEDRNIAAHIGYHDTLSEEPLTLKLLYLLGVGSFATVQRRLARLVNMGVVVKRRHGEDRRSLTLHLSAAAKRDYRRYAVALASIPRASPKP